MIELAGKGLTVEQLAEAARSGAKIELSTEAVENIKRSRAIIDRLVAKKAKVYGVTTGIGELANVTLSPEQVKDFQRYLIYSHAGGCGKDVKLEESRAAIIARLNTLCKGMSGIRLEVAAKIAEILNAGIVPAMCYTSVGACGDLAPMSQAMLVPLGEGEAYYQGKKMDAKAALDAAGISPIEYEARDGLAAINGSQLTAGMGALAVVDANMFLKISEIAGAMSLEALKGLMIPFDERLLAARGFEGGVRSAWNIRKIVEGSEILAQKAEKVQDAYSLRSMAQVTGAAKDALEYARKAIETEINGAADNPLFIPDDKEGVYLTGANFQGTPIAFPLEMLGVAITTIGVLSERRLNRLLNPVLSNGLPGFLTKQAGLCSGIMIPQYTAASLICENRVLSTPAATGSISVSADQEDFVSMGTTTAIKTRKIIDNFAAIIAIELLAAAQALEFRKPLQPGKGTKAAYDLVRRYVKPLTEDRPLYKDIDKITELVRNGEILRAVEAEVGRLR